MVDIKTPGGPVDGEEEDTTPNSFYAKTKVVEGPAAVKNGENPDENGGFGVRPEALVYHPLPDPESEGETTRVPAEPPTNKPAGSYLTPVQAGIPGHELPAVTDDFTVRDPSGIVSTELLGVFDQVLATLEEGSLRSFIEILDDAGLDETSQSIRDALKDTAMSLVGYLEDQQDMSRVIASLEKNPESHKRILQIRRQFLDDVYRTLSELSAIVLWAKNGAKQLAEVAKSLVDGSSNSETLARIRGCLDGLQDALEDELSTTPSEMTELDTVPDDYGSEEEEFGLEETLKGLADYPRMAGSFQKQEAQFELGMLGAIEAETFDDNVGVLFRAIEQLEFARIAAEKGHLPQIGLLVEMVQLRGHLIFNLRGALSTLKSQLKDLVEEGDEESASQLSPEIERIEYILDLLEREK